MDQEYLVSFVMDEKWDDTAFKLDSSHVIDMVKKYSSNKELGEHIRQYVNYLLEPDIYDEI